MKKIFPIVIAFGLFFLFFIQMAGALIESIYILDLMNTTLDAKALGMLFFFTPVLLFPFRRGLPIWAIWLAISLLFIARGILPYLHTEGRLYASGIGIGSVLLLFPLLLTSRPKGEAHPQKGLEPSTGLALTMGVSVLLRTLNYGIDISLIPQGGWIGWSLGLLLAWTLTTLNWESDVSGFQKSGGTTSQVAGIFLILALVYFSFSAPAVIARWTQGNYTLILLTVSLLSVGWVYLELNKPDLIERLSRLWLLIWNLLFALSLTGTILAHRVSLPAIPNSPAVIVGAPSWLQQIPLVVMLLTFPVVFMDMRVFFCALQQKNSSARALVPGMLLGSAALVVLVFIDIFTNVWGYVKPVSSIFRNLYYLPYLLIATAIALLVWRQGQVRSQPAQGSSASIPLGWIMILGAVFLGTGMGTVRAERVQPGEADKTSLVVMTYNIQQANDEFGERSYDRQLALIQAVSPDVLALQESDSARISLNNNDYVRYFSGKLGYYSYYGPTTVTGTFGTAILSKYPLQNPRSVFTFSDTDEIGTAEAEITVDDRIFTIYDVHPDGSDAAMLVFAKSLLERSRDKANVIALGDYNLRDYEEAYQLIATAYTNAWTSMYPSEVGADGTDMTGENRIDHIFFSPALSVRNPTYVLPPASATDHPVHWAEIYWKK